MVSNEAVEAAAHILYQTSVNRFVEPREKALELCKAEVRPILEAAAPHMFAGVWDEGVLAQFNTGSDYTQTLKLNPYRSQ